MITNSAFDWEKFAAFRNVLVHDYLGIDLDLVWTVVTRDVPEFKGKVTSIVGPLEVYCRDLTTRSSRRFGRVTAHACA